MSLMAGIATKLISNNDLATPDKDGSSIKQSPIACMYLLRANTESFTDISNINLQFLEKGSNVEVHANNG